METLTGLTIFYQIKLLSNNIVPKVPKFTYLLKNIIYIKLRRY